MAKQFSSNKEVKEIVKKALQQGWRVEKAKRSHILLYPPDSSDGFVTMSSTPSSSRNHKNIISILKAKGLKL